MRHSEFLATLPIIAILTTGLLAAPQSAGPLATLPSSYVELYKKIFDRESQTKHFTLAQSAGLSHVALRLWRQAHDPAYRQKAREFFEQAISDPHFSLQDFHVLHHFGELALGMRQEKLLTDAEVAKLTALAATELKAFCASKDYGDYNIRIGQVAGYAGLRKFLAGQPFEREAEVDRHLHDYWSKIAATGDLDEDASNYDSLGLAFLIDLARLLDRQDDLRQSTNFRRQFERFRDIVSPAGLIPEFGDAYFGYDDCSMDRIYLLEYAAKLYNDPTYLYAARKLYHRPQAGLPGLDSWTRALALINLDVSTAQPQVPSGPPSTVTYRARQQTSGRGTSGRLIDKMILHTGLAPGSAMVLLDLYASGSHSHLEKGPSIAYFEAAGVPLFHNLGRHGTRSAVTGNLLFALPAKEPFPGCFNKADAWTTMSIPVEYLSEVPTTLKPKDLEEFEKGHNDARENRHYLAGSFSLRNFPEYNRDCKYLSFDNLRLSGPGGERLVDGFEKTTGWSQVALKDANATESTDHTQGQFSQRLEWRKLKGGPTRTFPLQPASPQLPIDEGKYTHLKLDLKYTGKQPYAHIRGLGRQVDLGDQLFAARPAGARVEQRQHDAFGEVVYASYIEPDCRVTRRFVLTEEGYLVIQDTILAGKHMDGWNAGQLWQVYELQEEGPNWYCSASDGEYPQSADPQARTAARCMLVRYAGQDGIQTGVEKIEKRYHCPAPNGRAAKQFFTTYSYRPVAALKITSFGMIVVPEDAAGLRPAEAAAKIKVLQSADGQTRAEVVGKNGQKTTITLSADHWEVKR